jgi:hypothetical protein
MLAAKPSPDAEEHAASGATILAGKLGPLASEVVGDRFADVLRAATVAANRVAQGDTRPYYLYGEQSFQASIMGYLVSPGDPPDREGVQGFHRISAHPTR